MQEVLDKCTKELDSFINRISVKESDAKTFLKIITDAQTTFTQLLDALQATRPFYSDLFKAILKEYHHKFTNFTKEFWNKKLTEFNVTSQLNPGSRDT